MRAQFKAWNLDLLCVRPQFKNWNLDFASVPEHLRADTNLDEQTGLIRQAQRLCSQLVSLIHSDVLSVKSFNTSSKGATLSTVGIMLTYVLEERRACAYASTFDLV